MSVSYGGDSITFADGSVQSGGWTGMRNRIINGAMVIDQRNVGASVVTSAAYTLDRYYVGEDSDGTISVQQVSDAPEGFTNSIKFTVGTADASLAATQYAYFRQGVEGYNFADCNFGTANAKTVTVSFWVKSSVTGLFSGNLASTGHDRCYGYSFTINSANTWEYKTATIPGDTTGTWNKTNSVGVWLHFCLASGSTYLQSAGAWAAGTYLGTTGSTNLMATSGNTFQVTGVQLERGSTASSFEYRSFGTELALCQRYYTKSYNHDVVPGTATQVGMEVAGYQGASGLGGAYGNVKFPVKMRTTPGTINIWDGAGTATTASSYTYGAAGSGQAISNGGAWWGSGTPFNTSHSGFFMKPTSSQASAWNYVHYTADAEL